MASVWQMGCTESHCLFRLRRKRVAKRKSDKRQWQRIPLAIPVFIRGTDFEGRDFLEFATALNISAGGALVATRRQLPRCTKLSLEIPVAPVPRAITLPQSVRRLRAKLVRVTTAESYQLWALKFANILSGKTKTSRTTRTSRSRKLSASASV